MSSVLLWLPQFRDEDKLEPFASQAEERAEAVERLTLLFASLAAFIAVWACHTWRQDFVARTRAFGPLFRERLPQRPPVTARKQDKIFQRLEQRAQALDVKLRRFASRPLDHAAWPARPPGTWYAAGVAAERERWPTRPLGKWPAPDEQRPPVQPLGTSQMSVGALTQGFYDLPRPHRRAAPAMWKSLQMQGGAKAWLVRLRGQRRRIGRRALDVVWGSAVLIDRALLHAPLAKSCSLLRKDDGLEMHFRGLASWWHHHTTGDCVAANRMLYNPAPTRGGDIALPWLLSFARKRNRQNKRSRGLIRAPERMGVYGDPEQESDIFLTAGAGYGLAPSPLWK